MSDSSEEEDLSRFKEAVDNSFLKLLDESRGKVPDKIKADKPRSERYLDESTHYNDVKVPEELQRQIGAKISALINKNVEFVDISSNNIKKRKVKGGIKLFKESEEFLSCEEPKDNYTASHNIKSKKMKKENQIRNNSGVEEPTESEKLDMAVLTGEYLLSKEETKMWKSRRKEKLFRYKSNGKSKVLTAIE